MAHLWQRTGSELAGMIQSGDISAAEATDSVLARLEEAEPQIRSFVTPTPEQARRTAATVGSGGGAIAGVPIALKDIICTKGVRSTASSRMLENYVPP